MRRKSVPRENYLTAEELEKFEPAIREVAETLKWQREFNQMSKEELAQLIRIDVWKYGHSFNAKISRRTSSDEAVRAWVCRIGANALKRNKKARHTQLIDPNHTRTPLIESIDREEADQVAKAYITLLRVLSARIEKLPSVQREIVEMIAQGKTAHQIYCEILAKQAKPTKSVMHERVRGSRAVAKVLRELNLMKRPRKRK